MQVISSRAFRDSQKKYLDLATRERVIIKRKNDFLELVPRGNTIPDNPSPSLDPWFDNPKNLETLNRSIEQAKNGKTVILTKEMQQGLLGL
jgi:antitoxin YefM